MKLENHMTKSERLLNSITGKPVDRPPYGFWGHHFCAEYSLYGHVSSALWWQRSFDMDFIKVQARASHQVEDWGVRTKYDPVAPLLGYDPNFQPIYPPKSVPKLLYHPVNNVGDWNNIEVLDPNFGALGERLVALKTIRYLVSKFSADEPFILETVFNSITLAGLVLGWGGEYYDKLDLLRTHLHEYPEIMKKVMTVLTKTVIRFTQACLDIGIDGFFFATTQWGTYNRLTKEEYDEFVRPYDLQILDAMQDAKFIVLHVCKDNNMLLDLADYPVHAFSWSDCEQGNPSISEFRKKFPEKTILGGLSSKNLSSPKPGAVINELKQNWEITKGDRWIAAPDCSIPPDVSPINIRAAAEIFRK